MNRFHGLGFLQVLFFLLNAVTFNVDGADGGGGSAGEGGTGEPSGGDAGASGGDVGSQGGDGGASGGSGGSGDAGGSAGDNGDSGNVDLSSLPESTQKYIKDLRKENANYRTQLRDTQGKVENIENGLRAIFGEGDGDQVSPEEQVQHLSGAVETLQMQNVVLGIAVNEGLNSDQAEYFQFLLGKEAEGLEENEEIDEDRYNEILGKVKNFGGQNAGVAGGSTSVGGKAPSQGGSEVTAEQFKNMSYMEKVELRKSNEPLYNKLFAAVNN